MPPESPEKQEDPDNQDGELRMPMWEHLDELRNRLFKVVFALGIGLLVTFQFSEQLVAFLKAPILDVLPEDARHLNFIGVADKFIFYVKVSLLAAIALVFPFILYQVWKFVAPGLYHKERRAGLPFVFLGTVSFLMGLSFCYYVLLPYSFNFLINFGDPSDKPIITLNSYFSLTIKMLLGVGLLFEFPLVFLLLAFLGVLDAETLVKFRRHAVVVLLVASAVITPPDVVSQIIVCIPLWLLYEACIIGVRIVARKQQKEGDTEGAEINSSESKRQVIKTNPGEGVASGPPKTTSTEKDDIDEDTQHNDEEEEPDPFGGLTPRDPEKK